MARYDTPFPRLPVRAADWNAPSRLVRYSLAALATVVALLLRWAIDPYIGSLSPYTTLYPAIGFAAVYLSIGPSLLCTVVGGAPQDRTKD
jgi:hypothetical protein